jgi:transcriptional regulator with XRE-family HTH domain
MAPMPPLAELASLVGPVYGEWLRGQLKARKLTQRQFAQRSGVAHSTISRIIRGHRNPSLSTATRIVGALQRRLDRDAPGRGGSIAAARVESALRSDELLDEEQVEVLMRAYLAVRARAAMHLGAGPHPRLMRSSTQRPWRRPTASRPD